MDLIKKLSEGTLANTLKENRKGKTKRTLIAATVAAALKIKGF